MASINGKTDSNDIANEFAMSFKKIYDEANSDRAKHLTREFETIFTKSLNDHVSDDISSHFLSWDNMVLVMSKFKTGKASGSFISAEHILYGSPFLVVHLHLLFNSLIQHGYVPSDFLKGVITPIIKDAEHTSKDFGRSLMKIPCHETLHGVHKYYGGGRKNRGKKIRIVGVQ